MESACNRPRRRSEPGDVMTSRRLLAIALTLLAAFTTAHPAVAAPAASEPSSWNCGAKALELDDVRVELAPINPAERTPQGHTIKPTSAGGSWVPVILVHGWVSQSTHPTHGGVSDGLCKGWVSI